MSTRLSSRSTKTNRNRPQGVTTGAQIHRCDRCCSQPANTRTGRLFAEDTKTFGDVDRRMLLHAKSSSVTRSGRSVPVSLEIWDESEVFPLFLK